MSDRIDDVLRDLVRVDAPPEFARRVRAQLDATNPTPRPWPRLAAVAGALLLIAGLWMAGSFERKAARVDETLVGGTEVPPAQVLESTVDRHGSVHPDGRAEGTSVRAGRTSVRAGGASAPPTRDRLSVPDHEHALPALARLGTIGPDSLESIPMKVDVREVAALGAIAPIEIPALGADEGERR